MSRISLSGNPSGSGTLTIASPNTNSDVTINLPTVTGGNFIVSDASGNVGIGTSSPTAQLQVNRSGTSDYSTFRLSNSGASGKTYEIGVGGNTAAAGYANSLYFYDSTANALRMSLDTAGTLILNQGQIQFPATQNPSSNANTLDDYEEGTWTPSLGGNTTYLQRSGQYTKIGNLVHARCVVQVNAIGTGSANNISGLPFTSLARSLGSFAFFASLSNNVVFLSPFAEGTGISFVGTTTANTTVIDGLSIFTNNTYVFISVTYFTN